MKVRLSQKAADYVRQEASYLRQHSRSAADRFLERVKSVRLDLEDFAQAGFSDRELPVPNLRRFIRDGYRYDYRIGKTHIEIAVISSSVNTPLQAPDDEGDFEVAPRSDPER